jgi:hypothetical protein
MSLASRCECRSAVEDKAVYPTDFYLICPCYCPLRNGQAIENEIYETFDGGIENAATVRALCPLASRAFSKDIPSSGML